jgi:hypothetical protein
MTPLQIQLARSWVGQELIRAHDRIYYVDINDRKAMQSAKRGINKCRTLGLINHDRVVTDFPRGPIE